MSQKVLATLVMMLVIAIAIPANTASADSNHIRFFAHGVSDPVRDFSFGTESISGWLVASDITTNPNQWTGLVGIRHDMDHWWIELNGGGTFEDQNFTPVLDLRANFEPFNRLVLWSNLQWINFDQGHSDAFYAYGEADYWLLKRVVSIGVESENVLSDGSRDDLSAGIHLSTTLGKMTLVFAHQDHRGGEYHNWIRSVFNF